MDGSNIPAQEHRACRDETQPSGGVLVVVEEAGKLAGVQIIPAVGTGAEVDGTPVLQQSVCGCPTPARELGMLPVAVSIHQVRLRHQIGRATTHDGAHHQRAYAKVLLQVAVDAVPVLRLGTPQKAQPAFLGVWGRGCSVAAEHRSNGIGFQGLPFRTPSRTLDKAIFVR